MTPANCDVRFSNRVVWVKRSQAVHDCGDASLTGALATIGNNSIGDNHGIAKGRRAGSGPSDDDDTPSAIKTAAGQGWTGKAKAGEKQDTGLDPETAAGWRSTFVLRQITREKQGGLTLCRRPRWRIA
jgi:hypothetical protein